MKYLNHCLLVIIVILAALHVAACSQTQAADAPAKIEPAQVEAIEGTELNRLTLTEKAAQRLDIQTTQVKEEQVDGAQQLVVPYSSVIYDLEGATWIYISPQPLTYVREPITIDHIDGDMVFLTEGPATGTEVVTVGVPELYGADTGIGK
jgi:hypothetical protein